MSQFSEIRLFHFNDLTIGYATTSDDARLETVLCFHGFGRDVYDFDVFTPLLAPHQRFIGVQLFAHGQSVFPEDRLIHHPLEKSEWKACLEAFLMEMGSTSFHLFGYSMGGRVCMITAEIMPERVLSILLVAPDGLKINKLYRFASGTRIGIRLSQYIVKNPKFLFRTADALLKWKLLSPKLHRFVYVHMDTYTKRRQVYEAWLCYKHMFPKEPLLIENARKNFGKIVLVFGAYDSVITPRLGLRFRSDAPDVVELHELPVAHRMMTDVTRDFLKEAKPCWIK